MRSSSPKRRTAATERVDAEIVRVPANGPRPVAPVVGMDDCRASYEELSARGVEFVELPEERPYGIDSSFRDPSGNHIRLTQVREMASV